MKLSLCMIVKNEAEQLPRCLNSVKGLVDEMIVLDTGSTDQTEQLARSLGATVYSFAWCNDFSAARNQSLQYATGDWVLVLDADEVLVESIAPQIRQAIQSPHALVINLVRQEIGATQSPYSLVSRLFRRHPQIYFRRPYHAMVDDSVEQLLRQQPDWQIFNLSDVAILHYGYSPGAIAQRQKLETAKATMERFLATHPNDPYVCSKLGALYVQIGDVVQGMTLLKRGLAALTLNNTSADRPLELEPVPHSNFQICYELHYHLGRAYSRLKQLPMAEYHYRSALQQPILDCLKLGAHNNLGSILQAKGDLAGAKVAYQTCLAIDPAFATGYYNLGMVLKGLGQVEDAVTCYQQAIALTPAYAEAYQNLGVALLKLGRIPDSLQAFQKAINLYQQQNPATALQLQQGLQELGLQL